MTNTTPVLNQGGTVMVQELSLRITLPLPEPISGTSADGTIFYKVDGLSPDFPNAQLYTDNAANGVYTAGYNREGEWEWQVPLEYGWDTSLVRFPLIWRDASNATSVEYELPKDRIRGFDNSFNTKLIIIKAPESSAQSFSIRCKQCIEFRPRPQNIFARMAPESPRHNPAELEIYNEVVKNLPVAVRRNQNDNFWAKVKKAAHTALNVLDKTVVIGSTIMKMI